MNDLTNIYTDRREVETDKVVTHVPQWLLTTAVAAEFLALAMLVVGNRWLPWSIRSQLPLPWLFFLAHLLRAVAESVLLGALAQAFYRKHNDHEWVLEGAIVATALYHLLAATGYFVGFSGSLVDVSKVMAFFSVLLSCITGGSMAIYGYRRQRTVGLLLAAATLTAYPLWEEPGIAVLWWTANKVLTAWLYLLVRRLMGTPPQSQSPTPTLP